MTNLCCFCWAKLKVQKAKEKILEWKDLPSLAAPWKNVLYEFEGMAEGKKCSCGHIEEDKTLYKTYLAKREFNG
jgi:hypothetical protein